MITIAVLVLLSLVLIVQLLTWTRLRWIQKNMNMSNPIDLSKLQAAVTNNASVEASAITAFQGLAAEIKAANASGDQAAVDALADQINTSAASLATAVTANTPAATDGSAPVTPPAGT